MDWNLDITKVGNGYVATWLEDGEEYTGVLGWICRLLGVRSWRVLKMREVFEEPDDEKGELDCMVNLLNFIKEHFGCYGSKHDHYRLLMEIADQWTAEKGNDEQNTSTVE